MPLQVVELVIQYNEAVWGYWKEELPTFIFLHHFYQNKLLVPICQYLQNCKPQIVKVFEFNATLPDMADQMILLQQKKIPPVCST